jgi:hypothetical protein
LGLPIRFAQATDNAAGRNAQEGTSSLATSWESEPVQDAVRKLARNGSGCCCDRLLGARFQPKLPTVHSQYFGNFRVVGWSPCDNAQTKGKTANLLQRSNVDRLLDLPDFQTAMEIGENVEPNYTRSHRPPRREHGL